MPYQVEWLIENHIVLARPCGIMDLETFIQMDQAIVDHIRKSSAAVHVIVNTCKVERPVESAKDLIQNTRWLQEANLGWTVYIFQNTLTQMMGTIQMQQFHARCRIAKSIDEAVNFLKDIDDQLVEILATNPMPQLDQMET